MIRTSIPFGALILSACVSQAAYDEQAAQLDEHRWRSRRPKSPGCRRGASGSWQATSSFLRAVTS